MTDTALTVDAAPGTEPFSAVLREATAGGHSAAEGGEFLGALRTKTFSVPDFAALTAAHLAIYRALERATARHAGDPLAGPFVDEGLFRTARLEADLAALAELGEQPPVVSAARVYAQRIEEVADDPARFVAHHYIRYLGDMSGGQMIRHALLQQLPQLADATTFYDFPEVGPLGAFKRHYRELLDGVDAGAHDAIIDEVQLAYDFNVKVFIELDQLRK